MAVKKNTNISLVRIPERWKIPEKWLLSWTDKYGDKKSVLCKSEWEARNIRRRIDPAELEKEKEDNKKAEFERLKMAKIMAELNAEM